MPRTITITHESDGYFTVAEQDRRWVQPVESECDDWSSQDLHIPF